MNGRVSLLLALRYLRLPEVRSARLYFIPLVPLMLFGFFLGADAIIRKHQLTPVGMEGRGKYVVIAALAMYAFALVLTTVYWFQAIGGRRVEFSDRNRWLAALRLLAAVLLSVLAGPFSAAALIWYAITPKPQSPLLRWGLPVSYLMLFVLAPIALAIASHMTGVLSVHAELARVIGTVEWSLAFSTVALLVLIAAIRHLTIFTTISTYGMFLGSFALVVVLSVMSGFEADIKHKILGTHAHVVVTRPEDAFSDWSDKLPLIAKAEGVVAVTPFLSSEAMIASPGNRSNVVVKGIDPDTVGKVTDLSRNMEVGDLDSLAHPEHIRSPEDDPEDGDLRPGGIKPAPRHQPPGIILGRELAKSLRVYLGDDVSLVSPTGGIGPSGSVPKARPYRVAGIFFSGMFEYDSKFVYITLGSAQKLFDQADEVTGLEIKVPDPNQTDPTVTAIGKILGPGYEVADWKSLNRSLFSALALEKIVMFVFLSFIILVAAFSIIANGQMVASQKIGEIAILKSMGASNSTIAMAFFWMGSLLGGLGVLAGIGGGLLGALALRNWGYALDPDVFYLTQLPVRIDAHEILLVYLAGVGVTILATVQPAWTASQMQPVDGLREGGH